MDRICSSLWCWSRSARIGSIGWLFTIICEDISSSGEEVGRVRDDEEEGNDPWYTERGGGGSFENSRAEAAANEVIVSAAAVIAALGDCGGETEVEVDAVERERSSNAE
jgi:hypothetical protein